VLEDVKPALASAARHVSRQLGIGLAKSQMKTMSFGNGSGDEDEDQGPGEASGSGGCDEGRDDIPSVEVSGNMEGDIGPETPADPGPTVSPPGAGPTESKARAACTSSAYVAWWLEDAVCKSIKNPVTRSQCNDYNMREYTISLDLCREIP